MRGTNRNDHAAMFRQLLDERRRNLWRSRRNCNFIEWRVLRQAFAAIANQDLHVCVPKAREGFLSPAGQFLVPFDGIHLVRQFREQRRLIARPRADVENPVLGPNGEGLQSARHDIRLRDGLAFSDGNGMILIGLTAILFRNELVARNPPKCIQDTLIRNPAVAQLPVNHALALSAEFVGLWFARQVSPASEYPGSITISSAAGCEHRSSPRRSGRVCR